MRIANSVEKMQVFCAWSSLRMSACTVPRTCDSVSALMRSYVALDELIAGHAEQRQARTVVALGQLTLVAREGSAALDSLRLQLRDLALGASQRPSLFR